MLGPAEIHYLLEHTLYRDGEALAWDELTFNQQVWALNEMWKKEKKSVCDRSMNLVTLTRGIHLDMDKITTSIGLEEMYYTYHRAS